MKTVGLRINAWVCLALISTPAIAVQNAALIVGVANYADPEITPLKGVPFDVQSARTIARAFGIENSEISVLVDAQATKERILAGLDNVSRAVGQGGRAFVYFSGHGTRWFDPEAQGCVEGFLTHERQAIVNREIATFAARIGEKADKVVTMFDACHSGGVLPAASGTRSITANLTAKFFSKDAEERNARCAEPANVRTRSLLGEATRLGMIQENILQITSARPDEVSFDDAEHGGLATQGIRDCMLGAATDDDGSGAVTLGEVERCAQSFIDARLRPFPQYSPHHVRVAGARNLIPVSIAPPATALIGDAARTDQATDANTLAEERQRLAQTALDRAKAEREKEQRRAEERDRAERDAIEAARKERDALSRQAEDARQRAQIAREEKERERLAREQAKIEAQARARDDALRRAQAEAERQRVIREQWAREQAQVAASPQRTEQEATPVLASTATLRDIHAQRDARRALDVRVSKDRIQIGKDTLSFQVRSPRDGYLHVVMLGSDLLDFNLLFPNALALNNRVRANQTVSIPGPGWQLDAGGPPGTDHLLFLVSDSPRKTDVLRPPQRGSASPFTYSFGNLDGRAAMVKYFLSAPAGASASFSSSLVTIEEVR